MSWIKSRFSEVVVTKKARRKPSSVSEGYLSIKSISRYLFSEELKIRGKNLSLLAAGRVYMAA